jgi:hypothetical protein
LIVDEALRRRALDELGPLGDALARTALEVGRLEMELGVATWEASHGTVRAHRGVLVLPNDLHARVTAAPGSVDAITRAVAAAVAGGDPLASLYDLVLRAGGVGPPSKSSAYR